MHYGRHVWTKSRAFVRYIRRSRSLIIVLCHLAGISLAYLARVCLLRLIIYTHFRAELAID